MRHNFRGKHKAVGDKPCARTGHARLLVVVDCRLLVHRHHAAMPRTGQKHGCRCDCGAALMFREPTSGISTTQRNQQQGRSNPEENQIARPVISFLDARIQYYFEIIVSTKNKKKQFLAQYAII
jgi:hypothetical protein